MPEQSPQEQPVSDTDWSIVIVHVHTHPVLPQVVLKLKYMECLRIIFGIHVCTPMKVLGLGAKDS